MRRYRCHKEVAAMQIAAIKPSETNRSVIEAFDDPLGSTLVFVDGSDVAVSHKWIERHKPEVGGYFVQYADGGYTSYSPKEAFESGYTDLEELTEYRVHLIGDRKPLRIFARGIQTEPGTVILYGNQRNQWAAVFSLANIMGIERVDTRNG